MTQQRENSAYRNDACPCTAHAGAAIPAERPVTDLPSKAKHIPAPLKGLAGMLLAAGVFLSGCVRPDDGITEIQYSFWGATQQIEVEREIIAAFEAENPDIRVRPLHIGARYPDKIQAMVIGNVAPDVLMVEMNLYDEWASRGMLADVTDIVAKIEQRDPLLAVPRRAFAREEKFYAIPVNVHGNVLYTNLDALAQAGIAVPEEGWDWRGLLALGPRLSKRSGNPDAPTEFLMLPPDPVTLLLACGGHLFDDPYNPTQVTADSPEVIEAFRLIRDFFQSGYIASPEISLDEGTFQLFRDGRSAFYMSGRWMLPEFAGRTDFNWDILPIPSGPGGRISRHGGTAVGVWSGSKHAEAARRFLEFYTSAAGVDIVIGGGRGAPVTKNAAFGEAFLAIRPPESSVRYSETMLPGTAEIFLYSPGQAQVLRIFLNRVSQLQSMPDVPVENVVGGLAQDLRRWLEKRERAKTRQPADSPS